MTKTNRRKFLLTAAAAAVGALTAGIVEAETPVPVENIQAVPLAVDVWDLPPFHWSDYGCCSPRIRPTITYRGMPTYASTVGPFTYARED